MSTNFAKTLVWKQDYDVILWRHKQRTPNTNDYPMPLNETSPMKSFCVRHWALKLSFGLLVLLVFFTLKRCPLQKNTYYFSGTPLQKHYDECYIRPTAAFLCGNDLRDARFEIIFCVISGITCTAQCVVRYALSPGSAKILALGLFSTL